MEKEKAGELSAIGGANDNGDGDLSNINGARDFFNQFLTELKKQLYLAAPIVFTSICNYSLITTTQILAGHLRTIDLAAVSVGNGVITAFTFSLMLGMSSALETLCGQAYGAGELEMMGIYIQRCWLILNLTAFPLLFIYIFATPILNLIGQAPNVAAASGNYVLWLIPLLFAQATYFPIQKFLQAQSKIIVLALIAAATLILQIVFSWLFMLKLGWGLVGGAVMLNVSWWFMTAAQLWYVLRGSCGPSWSGFSWKAFHNLWEFAKLSISSAIMICLEFWFFSTIMILTGRLKNAEMAVGALSICTNITGWTLMIGIGFNVAVSVRVSNELGAGHPRRAKFSVVVVVVSSLFVGIILALILILIRDKYPPLFSKSSEVNQLVRQLTPLVAVSVLINNVQPALTGVAIGAGWQGSVARVNIICYYVFGLPLSIVCGFVLRKGVKGIWYGVLLGLILQTFVLLWMIYRTNWTKEATLAKNRIKRWGDDSNGNISHSVEKPEEVIIVSSLVKSTSQDITSESMMAQDNMEPVVKHNN